MGEPIAVLADQSGDEIRDPDAQKRQFVRQVFAEVARPAIQGPLGRAVHARNPLPFLTPHFTQGAMEEIIGKSVNRWIELLELQLKRNGASLLDASLIPSVLDRKSGQGFLDFLADKHPGKDIEASLGIMTKFANRLFVGVARVDLPHGMTIEKAPGGYYKLQRSPRALVPAVAA